MFWLVEEIERQDPSQDGISVFSLHFRGLSRGKGGLVEESESQDPSRDGISVFSLNCRVLSWGKGRRTEIIAQRMSGVGRSLACVGVSNGSEWLCQSCRIVAGSAGLLVVLVPGRFPNSQFYPSTDPVLFNCVPARFQTSQSRPGPPPGTESFRCPVDWSCVSVRRSASQSLSRSPTR